MPFILGEQRDADVADAFRRYQEYLESERHRFPPGGFALAASGWYFDFEDHRCPHDAWLQHLVIQETGRGERQENRAVGVSVQLLGAYHDLALRFEYRRVYRYVLEGGDIQQGHADWRYDEFRVTDEGHLLHEIEWSGPLNTSRWLIEAEDVIFESSALAPGA